MKPDTPPGKGGAGNEQASSNLAATVVSEFAKGALFRSGASR
jgi:hypothetical protein